MSESIELVSYSEFGQLRLADFYPDANEIDQLSDWEYMDGMWVGEGVGFTTFLRPQKRPNDLGSIELDLDDLPNLVAKAVLQRLHLPLERGMTLDRVSHLFGAPIETHQFVADRKTYDFAVGQKCPYLVSCTIIESQGLAFLSVMREDMNPVRSGLSSLKRLWSRLFG